MARGGPREVANPGGETWRDAIDAVLTENGGKMLVAEIVADLKRRGRRFGPNARSDSVVRATLNRNAARMGWSHSHTKPTKWWKRGGQLAS